MWRGDSVKSGRRERLLVANGVGETWRRSFFGALRVTFMSTKKPKGTVEIVRELIERFANQKNKDAISVADFLRLLSVLKDLDAERGIDEVRVKWVEQDKAGR